MNDYRGIFIFDQGLKGDELDAGFAGRPLLTPPHLAFLKISEGCDHSCAFCAIPLMRGLHRSSPVPDLVREAQAEEVLKRLKPWKAKVLTTNLPEESEKRLQETLAEAD